MPADLKHIATLSCNVRKIVHWGLACWKMNLTQSWHMAR